MHVLLVMPHYFHPEPDPRHSSVDETRRAERQRVVERVLSTWRQEFGSHHAVLNIERRRFEPVNKGLHEVTIVVLTTLGRHLIEDDFAKRQRINVVDCAVEDPRMLGHDYARFFAEQMHRFDLFIFSEDDLLVTDALFLDKLRWFAETFGYRRTLMPNRFEWNPARPAYKTYVDGDVNPRAWARWAAPISDEDFLAGSVLGASTTFRRARNPHSGMHVVTREQLDHWRRQPHWDDRDTSFIGPLESAATLGVLKTFAVYKPWGRSLGFLAVEHLDHRFSGMKVD